MRACPLCGSVDAELSRRFGEHSIVRCTGCGDAYVRLGTDEDAGVNEQYDEDAIAHYGAWYARRGRRRERAFFEGVLQPHFAPGRRLIDVGAGLGGAVAVAKSLGFDARGVDPSPWADVARARWGVPVERRRVEDLAAESFDVALTSATLEHIHRPVEFLAQIRRVLRPGGVLLTLAVPNYRELSIVLRVSWFPNNEPPHHVNYFEPRSIRRAHELAGFVDVRVATYGCDFPIQLAERLLARPSARGVTTTTTPAVDDETWRRADIMAERNTPRWIDRAAFGVYCALHPPGMGSMLRVTARTPRS